METKVYGDGVLLHKYMETLLGTKTKIKILRTLHRHRGKEFTIRELSDYTHLSHTGVRKALQDLYDMNAVTLTAQGRNHVIYLNQESHLTPLLSYLFDYEENTIQELREDIKQHLCPLPAIESAKIFGSIATGREEPRSDIDLLVITSEKEKTEETLTELQIHCSNKYGNLINPYMLTPEEEENINNQQLVKEIRENNIPICSKNR